MYKKIAIFIVIIFSIFSAVYLQLNKTTFATKNLTPKEKDWIRNYKKPFKVGITNIPNLVILKPHQKPTGFCIDIFNQISKETGLKFKYIPFKTWNEMIDAIKKRKIDILFLAQKTKDRLMYLNFTDVVLTQHNKIIIKNDNQSIKSIKDLYNKKVALVKNSALYVYVRSTYSQIIVIPVDSESSALKAVANKNVDATISEPVRASFYMKRYNIRNLMIAGDIHYNYNLRIASRRDLPMLNIILNKGVNNISPQIKKALYLKWGYIRDKEYYFDKKTVIYLLVAFGIILPFSFYLFLMNRTLKREILRREEAEKELMKLNKNLEKRVKEEVEKRQKQELLMVQQEKLAQIGSMVNMIAHQWKQPLNNISILVQTLVLKYHRKKLDDELIGYYQKNIKQQIQEMLKVMQDFMNFFKPKDDVKFTLNEIIKQTIIISKPIFSAKNIEIIYTNYISNQEKKYSDIVGQVIINIINNAKDALLENGVKNKQIEIKLFQENGKDIITIEDNAGGIPDNIIDKIFEPYFTTKGKTNGTGLGLYTCKMIVTEHLHGEIEVTNTKKGALFTIIL